MAEELSKFDNSVKIMDRQIGDEDSDCESMKFRQFLKDFKKHPKMIETVETLKRASFIINSKLHPKKIRSKFSKNLLPIRNSDIDDESRNTRRNSQYKSAVLVLFYHIAYIFLYKQSPTNDDSQILEDMRLSKKKEKRESHNKFFNKDYNIHTTTLLNRQTNALIDFAIEEFYLTFRTFTLQAMNLKDDKKAYNYIHNECKEKLNETKNENFEELGKKTKKRKSTMSSIYEIPQKKRTVKTSESLLNNDMIKDSKIRKKDSRKYKEDFKRFQDDFEKLQQLEQKIEISKNNNKGPTVLYKLYLAWLLECDFVQLFQNIQARLNEKYCPCQITRILQYSITHICKLRYTPPKRNLISEILKGMLKASKIKAVTEALLEMSFVIKYSAFKIPSFINDNEYRLLDIKKFPEIAKNRYNLFYTTSKEILNLTQSAYALTNSIHYTVIEYYNNVTCTNVLFDCISITGISKSDFNCLSWNERLTFLKLIARKHSLSIIEVKPISIEQLQYNEYPQGQNVYYYIRTSGLGLGTLFVKNALINSENPLSANKNIICTNKRHRKTQITDLELIVKNNESNVNTVINYEPSNNDFIDFKKVVSNYSKNLKFLNKKKFDSTNKISAHLNCLQKNEDYTNLFNYMVTNILNVKTQSSESNQLYNNFCSVLSQIDSYSLINVNELPFCNLNMIKKDSIGYIKENGTNLNTFSEKNDHSIIKLSEKNLEEQKKHNIDKQDNLPSTSKQNNLPSTSKQDIVPDNSEKNISEKDFSNSKVYF
nr:uncharacterized protein LOC128705226 [Cherax quadricarinatus]